MKKTAFILLSVILFTGVMAQAQNYSGNLHIGAGAGYHTEFEKDNTGVVLEGTYSVLNRLRLSPGILYYFTDTGSDHYDITVIDLNANAHLILINRERMRLYGLAGYNNFRIKVSYDNDSTSENESGINLGGGLEFGRRNLMLFGEAKITTGEVHDNNIILHGGIRFKI